MNHANLRRFVYFSAAPKPGENKAPPTKKGAVQDWLEKLGFVDSVGSSDYMFSFGNLFRYGDRSIL